MPSSQFQITPQKATRIEEDFDSPDLERVMIALSKMKKKDLAERAALLFSVLSSSWDRLYSRHTMAKAEWDLRRSVEQVKITSRWLAKAREIPWLLNGKKQAVAPLGMAIGTEVNRAIYGNDPLRIAHGLNESDFNPGLPQALGMLIAPNAREIIAQLREVKSGDSSLWSGRAPLLLRALSDRCRVLRSGNVNFVDGMALDSFRAELERDGLIYLQKYKEWIKPSKLLMGRDIFRGQRRFVSPGGKCDLLWKALKIRPVALRDCIDVISEIAADGIHGRREEAVLLGAFQAADRLLNIAEHESLVELNSLPLWTGDRYHKTRPLFVVADRSIAQALSGKLKFWHAPFDPMAKPNLLSALKVTSLGSDSLRVVGCEESNSASADIIARYQRALTLMKDRLAREDDACYRSANWTRLEGARLFIADALALEVSVRLGPGRYFSEVVPVLAHVDDADETPHLYFNNTEAIGSDNEGGRLIASFFDSRYRMQAAPLWFSVWSRADVDTGFNAVELAGEEEEENELSLEELAAASLGN